MIKPKFAGKRSQGNLGWSFASGHITWTCFIYGMWRTQSAPHPEPLAAGALANYWKLKAWA